MLQGCSELGYKMSYDKQIHVSSLLLEFTTVWKESEICL